MVTPENIKQWIEQVLPHSQAKVMGDGHHFDAVVVSPNFDGINTLKRHRMVYDALGQRMQSEIHALSIKTFTPDEYAQKE